MTGLPYNVMVLATYKDFDPIKFSLKVDYLANLDGRSKYVDLGTHIFIKGGVKTANGTLAKHDLNIRLAESVDDGLDDDQDDFVVNLGDGFQQYSQLEDQGNDITVKADGSI